MTDSTATIETIFADADALIRQRLGDAGIEAHHVILALAPDGAAVIRSNVGPAGLRQVAEMLSEIAEQAQPVSPGSNHGTRH